MLSEVSTKSIAGCFTTLGLSKDHAMVYIAALKLGKAPASLIAKEAKLPSVKRAINILFMPILSFWLSIQR